MAEPASSTTLAVTGALGAAALLPFVDGDALLGAVLGAVLIASTKKDISWWQRLLSMLLSVGLGYALAAEVVNQTPIASKAAAAFIASICAIPLSLKLVLWIEQAEIGGMFPGLSKVLGKTGREGDQ
jgi:hypothetical protein